MLSEDHKKELSSQQLASFPIASSSRKLSDLHQAWQNAANGNFGNDDIMVNNCATFVLNMRTELDSAVDDHADIVRFVVAELVDSPGVLASLRASPYVGQLETMVQDKGGEPSTESVVKEFVVLYMRAHNYSSDVGVVVKPAHSLSSSLRGNNKERIP